VPFERATAALIQSAPAVIHPDFSMPSVTHTTPGWAARCLMAAIRGYQRVLSPAFGAQCRFFPTCSHYTHEALARHGAIAGAVLGVWRVLRCHPLCAGGHDPVPDQFSLLKLKT
jgi:uncharacterized protein